MTDALDKEIIIKNSIKKLVINNLCRIFRSDIIFVGGLSDHIHVGLPLEKIKDLDLKIKLSHKDFFIHKLLYSNFYIKREDGKQFSVLLYKTFEPIRNFGIHKTNYESCDVKSYCFAYHLFVFGVCLDLFFYADNIDILTKYRKFIVNYSENSVYNFIPTNIETKNNLFFPNYKSRHDDLKNNNALEKRKNKFLMYSSEHTVNINNLLTDIKEYKLPKLYNPWDYQKINSDLKVITTKDGLIDHYLAHGITENRKYY
jgi:hypothetical protein